MIRERFEFNSGASVSIQANQFAYCEPRSNVGPYLEVEVGLPRGFSSQDLADLQPYQDGPDSQVYGYVPARVILNIIERHGGHMGSRDALDFLNKVPTSIV